MLINEKIIKTARQQVGLFIKRQRNELGLTQIQVSKLIGVTPATINKIEQGKYNWGIDLLFKLSIVLNFRFEFQTKEIADISGRFDLFENEETGTVIDNKLGIKITFTIGSFNATQKVHFDNNQGLSPAEIATAMREIGDWLNENYDELI